MYVFIYTSSSQKKAITKKRSNSTHRTFPVISSIDTRQEACGDWKQRSLHQMRARSWARALRQHGVPGGAKGGHGAGELVGEFWLVHLMVECW